MTTRIICNHNCLLLPLKLRVAEVVLTKEMRLSIKICHISRIREGNFLKFDKLKNTMLADVIPSLKWLSHFDLKPQFFFFNILDRQVIWTVKSNAKNPVIGSPTSILLSTRICQHEYMNIWISAMVWTFLARRVEPWFVGAFRSLGTTQKSLQCFVLVTFFFFGEVFFAGTEEKLNYFSSTLW